MSRPPSPKDGAQWHAYLKSLEAQNRFSELKKALQRQHRYEEKRVHDRLSQEIRRLQLAIGSQYRLLNYHAMTVSKKTVLAHRPWLEHVYLCHANDGDYVVHWDDVMYARAFDAEGALVYPGPGLLIIDGGLALLYLVKQDQVKPKDQFTIYFLTTLDLENLTQEQRHRIEEGLKDTRWREADFMLEDGSLSADRVVYLWPFNDDFPEEAVPELEMQLSYLEKLYEHQKVLKVLGSAARELHPPPQAIPRFLVPGSEKWFSQKTRGRPPNLMHE